jgi:acetyltransferase-like isoleucine patch superfamily enzyme
MKQVSIAQRIYHAAHLVKRLFSLRPLIRWVNIHQYYDAKSLQEMRRYASANLVETRSYPALSGYDIGAWTYGHPLCLYQSYGTATLKIGRYCSFAPDVKIFLAGEHRLDAVSTYPFDYMFADGKDIRRGSSAKGDVIIGNDVWLGDGALVLSGVRIGDGAVVAARAVVTKDVPPYAIVGGIPAKIIRMRFPPEIVTALLRIRWWDWPVEQINNELHALCDADVSSFVAAHDK